MALWELLFRDVVRATFLSPSNTFHLPQRQLSHLATGILVICLPRTYKNTTFLPLLGRSFGVCLRHLSVQHFTHVLNAGYIIGAMFVAIDSHLYTAKIPGQLTRCSYCTSVYISQSQVEGVAIASSLRMSTTTTPRRLLTRTRS